MINLAVLQRMFGTFVDRSHVVHTHRINMGRVQYLSSTQRTRRKDSQSLGTSQSELNFAPATMEPKKGGCVHDDDQLAAPDCGYPRLGPLEDILRSYISSIYLDLALDLVISFNPIHIQRLASGPNDLQLFLFSILHTRRRNSRHRARQLANSSRFLSSNGVLPRDGVVRVRAEDAEDGAADGGGTYTWSVV